MNACSGPHIQRKRLMRTVVGTACAEAGHTSSADGFESVSSRLCSLGYPSTDLRTHTSADGCSGEGTMLPARAPEVDSKQDGEVRQTCEVAYSPNEPPTHTNTHSAVFLCMLARAARDRCKGKGFEMRRSLRKLKAPTQVTKFAFAAGPCTPSRRKTLVQGVSKHHPGDRPVGRDECGCHRNTVHSLMEEIPTPRAVFRMTLQTMRHNKRQPSRRKTLAHK